MKSLRNVPLLCLEIRLIVLDGGNVLPDVSGKVLRTAERTWRKLQAL